MKKSVMEKWTKELESGRYRQTTGVLKKPRSAKAYGHCCLGVLCDIYARETGKGNWETESSATDGAKTFVVNGATNHTELPDPVRKWAGLNTPAGDIDGVRPLAVNDNQVARSLVTCNDDLKLSFKEIAKVIRKNYKKL